jgi:hypothetical protein
MHLSANQFEHMPQGFSLDLIKGLGEQGNGVECIRGAHNKATRHLPLHVPFVLSRLIRTATHGVAFWM